jgi:hypothetical protein
MDPWHASGLHVENVRFQEKKPINAQHPKWTYPLTLLSEFQEEVIMNSGKWRPNRNGTFKKQLRAERGVVMHTIKDTCIPKVRNFVHRWTEDENIRARKKSGEDSEEDEE